MAEEKTGLTRLNDLEAKLAGSPIGKAVLDGVLSVIPGVGAAVSSVISSRAAALAQANTRRLFTELRRHLDKLDENALDKDFLDSDEFTTLVLRVIELNARAHRTEKSTLFAAVFVRFLERGRSSTPFKEDFIRLIDQLEPEHIAALAIIYRGAKRPPEGEKPAPPATGAQVASELGLQEGRAVAYCEQMIRYGLVRDWSIGHWDYEPGKFDITEYGREFCEHLGDSAGARSTSSS